MKTARITTYGGPEVIAIHDAPAPDPAPGEVLVAAVASSINPVDVKAHTPGTAQQISAFPATLGWDVAGIVLTAPTSASPAPSALPAWPCPTPGWSPRAPTPTSPGGENKSRESWQGYAATS